ncbi:type II toxin-antitoxin system HicB family antitoxin [Sporolactobacillus sp. CQH2019]|uniref:type II toxin-antitoxin system HicB family antitoxin n=1 Tax=Sporolactobacillus sp. CQH2019 TaxID=3023512 RepID=UPI002367B6AB|nr:type II toxin-antitoxin system HicB family antitoxin [Sporolactobacillus sp. CQH2019]MDD9149245.1 type II toxin-antitoxin system HicB family antitoxin [Sporolactobacillus sp. CQH2019]
MKHKDRYIYPAVFEVNKNGISVEFPDLPGCLPYGKDTNEAFKNAKEALSLHLYGMEEDGETIPEPTDFRKIKPSTNNSFSTMIEAWMPPFRYRMENQSVKKTLTIPKWLDDVAKENKVNYSGILQDALKDHLGIKENLQK